MGDGHGSSAEPRGTGGWAQPLGWRTGLAGDARAERPASDAISRPRKGVRISTSTTPVTATCGFANDALPAKEETAPPQTPSPDAGRPLRKGLRLREIWPSGNRAPRPSPRAPCPRASRLPLRRDRDVHIRPLTAIITLSLKGPGPSQGRWELDLHRVFQKRQEARDSSDAWAQTTARREGE